MSIKSKNKEVIRDKNEQESENKYTNEDEVHYDKLLSSAGEFGMYQVLMFLATCPFFMYGVYAYYTQMFITEVSPNHWCWIPELEHLTDIERRNLAIPNDDSVFGYSRCTAYVANWTEVLETGEFPDNTWETATCQNGWEFNKTEIPYPTISSELGWVCDKDRYQTTAQSLFSVGCIAGGIIFGLVADRFGRVPAAVCANLVGCIGGISTMFATNIVQFSICRIITGVAYDNCMVMVYLLVLEYVAPKYRSILLNVAFAVFYSLFATTLPFLALALGHWRLISLVTSLPFALAIFTPLIIPESPRWLLSKGRVDETIHIIQKIARVNKKVIPSDMIEKFKWTLSKEQNEENLSIVEVFKRPVLRKVLILVCLEYMAAVIVFDGLLRSTAQLDFDFFISFAAISITELPSMLLLAFVLDFFGRRWLNVIVMSVSCVFALLTQFVGSGFQSVIFAMVARFAVNMSYGAVMQWAAELLPTAVRGSGVSFVHICGFVALAISPYIVYLNTIINWLPLVIIGAIAAAGTIMALFLPETSLKEMPHTFEDAEELATSQQFCEMPCLKKNEKNTNHTEEYTYNS